MKQYQNLIKQILIENGNSEGVHFNRETHYGDSAIVFGTALVFDLKKGFPLVTTHKQDFESINVVYDQMVKVLHHLPIEGSVESVGSTTLQFNTDGDSLDLFIHLGLTDVINELPQTIAHYALALNDIANTKGLTPRLLKVSIGICELFEKDFENAIEIIERTPYNLPRLTVNGGGQYSLFEYTAHPKVEEITREETLTDDTSPIVVPEKSEIILL